MELAFAAAIAALVSAVVCRSLTFAGPVDAPNAAHKKHASPTPTAGGLGIAAGLASALMALALYPDAWRDAVTSEGTRVLVAAAAFSYIFLAIGFYDDANPLGPRLKTLLFALAAVGAVWVIGPAHKLQFGFAVLRLSFVGAMIGSALWVFAMVNFVNFMDGANGLAMGMMAIGMATLGALAFALGLPSGAALSFCTAGALVGFLIWNFPKGRLFAGDSGALLVGALAALSALLVIRRTEISPFVAAILFLPTIADATLTLIWRASRGHALLDGHSEHIYQIAIRAGWEHWQVAILYWLITAICCVLGYIAAFDRTGAQAFGVFALLSAAFVVIAALVRRAALKRGIAELPS